MNQELDQVQARKVKVARITELQGHPYPNAFTPSTTAREVHHKYGELDAVALEGNTESLSVAGRIMFIRDFGKGAFFKCRDSFSEIQLFLSKKDVTEETFELAKLVDAGDWVYVSGTVFRTQKGELSVKIRELTILSKCLRPLPEKFHGLTDVEQRYRKRYLDLIMNQSSFGTFASRSKMTTHVRQFFEAKSYLEVETPMMQHVASGALARPFKTHHNALDLDLYLRVAPELFLKRLIVGGFPKVFEINRNFRNEGISPQHNPEFTELEYYEAYATCESYIGLTENLFADVCQKLHGSLEVAFGDHTLSFKNPFKRLHMFTALQERLNVSLDDLFDRNTMIAQAGTHGIDVQEFHSAAEISVLIFETLFEAELIQPTFVVGYPVEVSPLARRNDEDPRFTDRFELYIGGFEVANGFSELNDPEDQRSRFEAQDTFRKQGNFEALPVDWEFIEALSHGMPPTAGAGIGIDRMAMVLLNQPSIRDVILFPTLKP